ncbi:MAG: methyltransferase domain-containing protein [Acetobacter sp.]
MRELPFADASFDRIVSRYAIRNISDEAGRAKAVREISRVLAPKGQVVISDIMHVPAYAQLLLTCGLTVRIERDLLDFAWTCCSFGTIRPRRLVATRP